MIFKSRLKKWGGSLGIVVDNIVVKELDLREDSLVRIDIIKELEIKHYRCRHCGCDFHSNDDVVYCPVCDIRETIEEIKDDM